MSLQTFFDNFELLADAPNGVAKLRNLILQFAVEGRLVPQNSGEEPAAKLLKRIRESKDKLAKQAKVSKRETVQSGQKTEMPFSIPNSWEWVRLDQITDAVHYGYTASADHSLSDVRLLRITDIQNGKVEWANVPGCEIDEEKLEGVKLANDDIVIARTGGTIGKSYLVENLDLIAVFASYLIRAVPNKNLFARYLKTFLESELYWSQLYEKSMGTGQPNVNATSLKSLRVPLPPFEEQRRIVAKVDELMGSCDELESRQQARRKSRMRLNNVTLVPLNNLVLLASEDFEQAYQRLDANFATLYDSAETVDKLRSTILQLALQGKLVPQDPNDGLVSELLHRFRGDIEKLKKDNGLADAEKYITATPVPSGWASFRLGELVKFIGGSQPPKSKFIYTPEDGYTRLVQIRDYKSEAFKTYVPNEHANRSVNRDDVMIGRYGPPVFQILRGLEGTYNVALMKAAPIENVLSKDYLFYLLQEPKLQSLVVAESERTAGQSGVRKELLHNYVAALPPLAEQERIVVKVKKLMALCDELEARLRKAESDSEKLMSAAVQHVLSLTTEPPTLTEPGRFSNG